MDLGTDDLSFETEAGRVNDQGNYAVVRKSVDGERKMVADIYNGNVPAE